VPAQGFAVDVAPFDKAFCLKCEEAKFACQHVVMCIIAFTRAHHPKGGRYLDDSYVKF